jgi:hypothetical protein
MSPKTFTGLAIAAVASLVLAAVIHASANSWVPGAASGDKLFPVLPRDAARAAIVTITQGSKSIAIERNGDNWSLKDRGGYPASAEKIRALLLRLANAEIVDAKTRNPERHNMLDLGDPKAPDAKSRLITVTDDKGRSLVDIIVGKRSSEQLGTGKGGTYVRRPNQNETWLVNVELDPTPAVPFWVDTTMFETHVGKAKGVTVEIPGEKPIEVVKAPEGKIATWTIANIPEGMKLKYDYAGDDMLNAFSRMELEDVRRAVQMPPGVKPTGVSTYRDDKGLEIIATVYGTGDDRWMKIMAKGTEGDPKTEADKINEKVKDWDYKIGTWKLDQMFKKPDELFEKAG